MRCEGEGWRGEGRSEEGEERGEGRGGREGRTVDWRRGREDKGRGWEVGERKQREEREGGREEDGTSKQTCSIHPHTTEGDIATTDDEACMPTS